MTNVTTVRGASLARRDRSPVLDACAAEVLALPDGEAAGPIVAGWLREYRGNTRAAYARDLAGFAAWLARLGFGLLDADRATVAAYSDHLAGTLDRRPSTVRRALGALSSFYRYAFDAEAVDRNPAERVRRPQGDPTLTPALSAAEAGALLSAAEDAGPRDVLLVALLLGAGLRVSEALGLDAEDVETTRGHCSVIVHGKGGREDRVTLSAAACDALDRLDLDTGPLLRGASGERMTRDGATAALRRLSRAAGLDPVRPHTLRATAVTVALESGVPLRDVQDFARHADPRTTRRYDRAAKGLDRHAATTAAIMAAVSTPEPVA